VRKRSLIFAAAAGVIALRAFGVASSGVRWEECRTCGVQRYDRKLLGIDAGSEPEYDDYGTYAAWKSVHGGNCNHQFTPIDRAKGPAAATRPHR
jgi:hypothetical protein